MMSKTYIMNNKNQSWSSPYVSILLHQKAREGWGGGSMSLKDLSSIPRTHMKANNHLSLQFWGDPIHSSGLLGYQAHMW